MGKSPLLSEFLELMVVAEQISGVAVLRSVVTGNFLWDSRPRQYFLQVVDDTNGSVLAKQFYFKALRIEVSD